MTAQDDNYILAHPPNLEFIQGHLKEPANNEQIREQLLFWKHWVFSDSVIRKPLHLIIYTLGFIYFLYMIIVGVRAIVQLSSIIGSLRISGILDILAILGLFIFIVIGVIIMSCMCIICAFFFYHLLRFSPDTLDKDYDDLTQHGQLLDGQIVYVIRLSMTSARLIYKFTAPNGKIIRRIITVRNSQIIQKNVGKKVKILYLDPQRNVIL